MKTLTLKTAVALLATSLLLLGAGCAAVVVGGAAVGMGTAIYKNGELRSREYVGYDAGWAAATAAMNDLGYAVVSQDKTPVEGKLTVRAPGDKKLTVRVTKVTGTITEFGVRIGTLGDKPKSQPVLDAIKKRL